MQLRKAWRRLNFTARNFGGIEFRSANFNGMAMEFYRDTKFGTAIKFYRDTEFCMAPLAALR